MKQEIYILFKISEMLNKKELDLASFGDDYKAKYAAIKEFFDRRKLTLHHLIEPNDHNEFIKILDELKLSLDMIEMGSLLPEQTRYFLCETFPGLVKAIMNR